VLREPGAEDGLHGRESAEAKSEDRGDGITAGADVKASVASSLMQAESW
jgi:hypothetical protein